MADPLLFSWPMSGQIFSLERASFTLALSTALALSLGLSACAFKEDSGDSANKSAPPAKDIIETIERERDQQANNGQINESNVSIKFEEMPDPNSYLLSVQWPVGIKRMSVTIDKDHPSIVHGSNVFERVVIGGSVVDIGLISFDSLGAQVSSHHTKANVPKDFVVNNLQSLQEPTEIRGNRLFFRKGGQILTNTHALIIDFNKIFVEDGDLGPTFLPVQSRSHILTTIPGTITRSTAMLTGSNIRIRAKSARGKIFVALVGVDGRAGPSGLELEKVRQISRIPDPKQKGADGSPARGGTIIRPCAPIGNPEVNPNCEASQPVCHVQPGNGHNGLKGATGTDGGAGEQGGNSGILAFDIQDHSTFSADVFVRTGLGGKGGEPAPGFPGGFGGSAGATVIGCGSASNGAQGQPGEYGQPGADGKSGSPSEIISGGISIRTSPL